MDWICPHCKELFVFDKPQQKGAHITNCKANPKREEIDARSAKSKILPRIEVIKTCPKCDLVFSQFKTAKEIEDGKEVREYCSRSCANSHVVSDAHKEKVSATLKEGYESGRIVPVRYDANGQNIVGLKEQRACPICGTVFECVPSLPKQTCSKNCSNKLLSQKLNGTGKTGGWRPKKRFMHGTIKLDSSWEVALAKRLDSLGIKWESSSVEKFFIYQDVSGRERKYHPDFYLPDYDLYLECKGAWTPEVIHKMQDVQKRNQFDIVILDDIKMIRSFNI